MTNSHSNTSSIPPMGICCDHAGYPLKEEVKKMLTARDIDFQDFGTYSEERADYPDFAHQMGKAIDNGTILRGIAICGSGNGISMTLNKYPSVRAALCWLPELGALARAHNDANVLSLPGRYISASEAEAILDAFLTTPFEGGRHTARVAKIPIK